MPQPTVEPANPSHKFILLWDGECQLCRRASLWLKYWDKKDEFTTYPYQDAPTPPMTPDLYRECEFGIHIVKPDGSIINKGRAAMFALERFGWGWFARLMTYPPFIWVIELGYHFVAENRPWLANFIFTKEPPKRN